MPSTPPPTSHHPLLTPCVFNSNASIKMSRTRCSLPKHAGMLTFAPRSMTCNQTHALHGNISVFLLEALLSTIKRMLKWQWKWQMINLPPMAKKIWQFLDPTLIASSTIIVLSTPPFSLTSFNSQLSMTLTPPSLLTKLMLPSTSSKMEKALA